MSGITSSIDQFRAEVDRRGVHTVELAAPDTQGHLRGKRIPVERFTDSVHADGANIADAMFVFDMANDLPDNEFVNMGTSYLDCRLAPDNGTGRILGHRTLVERATEEILRWSTPVMHMRRTTTRATELAGTAIGPGEKVVLRYSSWNRDERVFDRPAEFDVGRADNPHHAFGGGGPHLCLGAYLARLEISVLLEEMADRDLRLERVREPVRVASNFVNGVSSVELGVR